MPAVVNTFETAEVLPDTAPLHEYWYGAVPPETEAEKVLLWPAVMLLGEAEQATASGFGAGFPKFIVKVRLPPLLRFCVAAGVMLVSGPGPPWL